MNVEENRNETILKIPVKQGTSWKTFDERQNTITGTGISVTTPEGVYNTIEAVTTVENSVMKRYHAVGIGLVKSVYTADGFEMVSELVEIIPE